MIFVNNEHFPKVTLAAQVHYQSYRKDVNQVIHGYPLLPGLKINCFTVSSSRYKKTFRKT